MPLYLPRPAESEYNPYYGKYIAHVPEGGDFVEVLAHIADETLALLRAIPENTASYAYAEGKWTIKQVVGHVCDAERIFSYRMLRIGRGDQTPLASFDENAYAPAGQFNQRTLASLIEEFAAIRAATIALVAGMPSEAWLLTGVASNWPFSTRALAYITAGHELHHRDVLMTRYLPQISS